MDQDAILNHAAAELLNVFKTVKKVCGRGEGMPGPPWNTWKGWLKAAGRLLDMSANVRNYEDYMMALGRHKLKLFLPHEFVKELNSREFAEFVAFQNNTVNNSDTVCGLDGKTLPQDARASARKFQEEFAMAMQTIIEYAGTSDMHSAEARRAMNLPYVPIPARYMVLLGSTFPEVVSRYSMEAMAYWAAHPLEAAAVACYLGIEATQLSGFRNATTQPGT